VERGRSRTRVRQILVVQHRLQLHKLRLPATEQRAAVTMSMAMAMVVAGAEMLEEAEAVT